MRKQDMANKSQVGDVPG